MKIPLFVLVSCWLCDAQENSRQIWDDYFGSTRPGPHASASQQRSPQYRLTKPAHKPVAKEPNDAGKSSVAIGVTVWKLQPPLPGDGARLLLQEPLGSETPVQLTPHRMEANELLKKDDRVRLSVESPMSGYIYVIDQEMHANGTLEPPYLIFPTNKTRGGNNSVHAGQMLEIPAQTDRPNVFKVTPKSLDESGEKVTIIVSPAPISGLTVTDREQILSTATFESWVREWGSDSEEYELEGGKGQPWTASEKQAGQDGSRLLTQDDPPPQTVFVFPGRAGKSIVASLNLQLER